FVVGGPVGDSELLLCHGMVCVVGRMRDLILQLSKSSIYSTKPHIDKKFTTILSSGTHWIDSWQQINEQLTSLRAEQQRQNTQLLLSNNDILTGINASGEKMVLLNTLLIETLETAGNKSNFARNELSLILEGLNACRYSFEDVSSKLRTIVSLSVDRD
ncbi:hypothetical protein, partial [Citrobacter portucalensis]